MLAHSLRHGYTPAYVAAEAGNSAVLRQLITARADPFRADKNEVTPLDRAASRGHAAAVRLLVATHVERNGPNAVLNTQWLAALLLTDFVREALQQRQVTFEAETNIAVAAAEEEREARAVENETMSRIEEAERICAAELVARVSELEAKWFPVVRM